MSTFSEEIKLRYTKSESEVDKFDRIIVVKRMKPSEMLAVRRIADSDRQNINLDAVVAGSVRSIDGTPYSPIRSQADLDIVLDALQQEGLTAAATAWARLMGFTGEEGAENAETVVDQAKNSPATPS